MILGIIYKSKITTTKILEILRELDIKSHKINEVVVGSWSIESPGDINFNEVEMLDIRFSISRNNPIGTTSEDGTMVIVNQHYFTTDSKDINTNLLNVPNSARSLDFSKKALLLRGKNINDGTSPYVETFVFTHTSGKLSDEVKASTGLREHFGCVGGNMDDYEGWTKWMDNYSDLVLNRKEEYYIDVSMLRADEALVFYKHNSSLIFNLI